ncbi:hypothetical protein COLSTE_00085 [Collinsella stercoris DSM 13279]|uniref:Uncharacterized protein n=2 Tax=Collinsella TaxID=102106 RepID=B6G7P5_9ACTN|nr:hypothetical protein COLSTE_00085 [Collinsella stercoris DSM 13279]
MLGKKHATRGGSSMAAETKEYKSYLANKCVIGYGIINGIVNAAIFFGMNASNPDVTFAAGKIIEEIVMTGALLGLILTWCVVPLTKMDLKKGVYKADADCNSIIAKLPGGTVTLSIPVGIIAALIAGALAWVFTLVLPLPLTRTSMMVFKGCMCAIVGLVSGFIVVTRTTIGFELEAK